MSGTLSPALVSHGLAAAAFAALAGVLVAGWRGRQAGAWLIGAAVATSLWGGALAAYAAWHPATVLLSVEPLRHGAWMAFLLQVMAAGAGGWRRMPVPALLAVAAVAVVGELTAVGALPSLRALGAQTAARVFFGAQLAAAVVLLLLLEQVWRNTRADRRWAVKYLCVALALMAGYDVFLAANGLLVGAVDPNAWAARGAVVALAAPLLAVAAARNPQWSLDVFVSRRMAMHTATLLGTGAYLLVMAAAGQWIRATGGSWGAVAQITFLAAAVAVLALLFVSGGARARLRVFLDKHFFSYRYDYREEWLHLTDALSGAGEQAGMPLAERVGRALAGLVESPGAVVWRREGRGFEPAGAWNLPLPEGRLREDDPLLRLMTDRGWVVDLEELRERPERYGGITPPPWCERLRFVVPLFHGGTLAGVAGLAQPRVAVELDWETRDLLRTAGRQAASYLVLEQAAAALTEARQFEAFNRLAAVVVHDLKNLIAQLDLVVRNAERHRGNPEFMDDAMGTVANAVRRMGRLMEQLRSARACAAGEPVNLSEAVERAVAARSHARPVPRLVRHEPGLWIRAERERLQAVVEHLIQNAQEATPADGRVEVLLERASDREAVVEIRDTGEGMTPEFVRERLFRPFDTTKGVTGMGIGAYEAREFARAAGGEVEVESAPGEGTVFRLRFPLAAVEVGARAEVAP